MMSAIKTVNNKQINVKGGLCAQPLPSNQPEKLLLSVIVLAEEGKIEELNDLFLCLSAQESTQFEIIVLVLSNKDDMRHKIVRLCDYLYEVARTSIRTVSVGERNPLAVLNETIVQLESSYFAVISGRDLLFNNWVSSFLDLAKQNSNEVLFVYPLRQEWQVRLVNEGQRQLKAIGSINNCYCHGFNYLDQLNYNDCPSVGLAFPTHMVQKKRLKYDENLVLLGSWDFLMCAVAQCGIRTCDVPSSIVRAWKSEITAQRGFEKDEWYKEHDELITKHSTALYRDKAGAKTADSIPRENLFSPEFSAAHCVLTLDRANLNRATNTVIRAVFSERMGCDLSFSLTEKAPTPYIDLVFIETAGFTLHHFKALFIDGTGAEREVSLAKCKHNGYKVNWNHILFIDNKPMIRIKIPDHFETGELHIGIIAREKKEETYLNYIRRGRILLFVGRCWRFAKRRIREMLT